MKKLVMVLMLLTVPAYAQPENAPADITPKDTLSVAVGRAQKLRFPMTFDNISFATKDIVEAIPLSDREMMLQGLNAGETIMIVQKDGREVYSAIVAVGAEPGHTVKLYGRRGVKDYVGYYCTGTDCGRADKELNGARDVSSDTVTTLPGGAVSRTQTYGR